VAGYWKTVAYRTENAQGYLVTKYKKVWVDTSAPKKTGRIPPKKKKKPKLYNFLGRKYKSYAAYAYARNRYRNYRRQQRALADRRKRYLDAQRRARTIQEKRRLQDRYQRLADREKQTQRDEQMRRQKAILADRAAAARRKAYDALARRRRIMAFEASQDAKDKKRLAALIKIREQNAERDIRDLDAQDKSKLLGPNADRAKRMGETYTGKDVRNQRLLDEARKSGDYTKLLNDIKNRQKRTGGRYLDQDFYSRATKEIEEIRVKAENEWVTIARKIQAKFDAGDFEGAQKLYLREGTQSALENYKKWRGDGRQPGLAQKYNNIANDIARANDLYYEKVVFGNQLIGNQFTDSELSEYRKRLDELLTRTRSRVLSNGMSVTEEYQMTVTEYLRELSAAERKRMEEQRRDFDNRLKMLRFEGFETEGGYDVDGDGRGSPKYVVDLDQREKAKQIRKRFLDGGLDEATLNKLLDTVQHGSAVDRQRAMNALIAAGKDGWVKQHQGEYDFGSATSRYNNPAGIKFQQDKAASENELWKFLTGQDKPEGLAGLFSDFGQVPVLSEVLKGLGIAAGGVGLAIRGGIAGLTGGGELDLPDFNYDRLFPGDNFDLSKVFTGDLGIDTSEEAKQRQRQAIIDADILGGWDQFSQDPIKFLEGVSQYGAQPAQGNLSLLLSAVTDPTIALSLTKFLSAGRLATARAGGLRASMLSPRLAAETGVDFYKLLAPGGNVSKTVLRGLKGYGYSEFKNRLALANVGRIIGRNIDGWDQLSEADKLALAADIQRAKTTGQVTSVLGRVFKRDQINAEQILADVQRYAAEYADTLDVVATDAVRLEKEIAQALAIEQRAARVAAGTKAKLAREADESLGATALASVRREVEAATGVAAPARAARPQLPLRAVRLRGRLERDYQRALAERTSLSQDAADAARILRESEDFAIRRGAATDLRAALAKLDAFEDKRLVDPVTGVESYLPGVITRRREMVADFDRKFGTSSRPPGFMNVTKKKIADDTTYVTSEIARARARLKAAKTAGEVTYWRNRLRRLGSAQRYLNLEKNLASGANETVKSVRKFTEQAKDSINPSRIASKALTREQAAEELGRDVYRRLWDAQDATVSTPTARAIGWADQVAYDARQVAPDRSVTAIDDVMDEVGDVDLYTLAQALDEVVEGGGVYSPLYRSARDAVFDQLLPIVKTRFPAAATVNDFLEVTRVAHQTSGAMSLREFRRLDGVVQKAVQHARRKAMEGTVKVREQSKITQHGARRLGSHETELDVAVAKIKALDAEGVSLKEYDEARGALGDISVRFNNQSSLRREARRIARAKGISEDAAFLEAREARRTYEARLNLEQFAAREEFQGLTPEEIFSLFQEKFMNHELRPARPALVTPYQRRILEQAFKDVSGVDASDVDASAKFLQATNAPEFGNRSAMRDWLVENGFWSPRTEEAIRQGDAVWSIAEERKFWESAYGHVPEWTKEEVLRPILRDPQKYAEKLREWGFYDNEFEQLAVAQHIREDAKHKAIAFGSDRIKRGRTREELRDWFYQRYGSLVSDDGGKTFKEVPWLMDAKTEYVPWLRKMYAEGFANPSLFGDVGVTINRELIRGDQIVAYIDAIEKVVQRRLDNWLAEGKLVKDTEFLPQEQLYFAFEVVNELMLDPRWRSIWAKNPVGSRMLGLTGALMRLPTLLNPSFPIMNIMDRVGVKPWLVGFASTWGKMIGSYSPRAMDAIRSADDLPGSRNATWYLRGTSGVKIARDRMLPMSTRVKGMVQAIAESPLQVSKTAEDSLRLHFAWRVYDDVFETVTKNGADEVAADLVARSEVRKALHAFFPSLDDATDFEKALNQIIPFFSYNFRNKVIGLRMAMDHPWLLSSAEKLGGIIEDRNREIWEEDNPGVPFPNDQDARRLHIDIGGTEYTIDLSNFSDYFRGFETAGETHTVDSLITEFIRIPHPTQAAAMAWLFGYNDGLTPYGTPATLADFFWPASVWDYWNQQGMFDPDNPRYLDNIQFISRSLFWQAFGRTTPLKAKVQQFFYLMENDRDAAWVFYRENPDLDAYFALNGANHRIDFGQEKWTWFKNRDPEDVAAYQKAFEEYNTLKDRWDDTLDEYYLKPWDPKYRELKQQRRAALATFLKDNPILGDVWSYYNLEADWADQVGDWVTDEQVDEYFDLDKLVPKAEDFETDLAFQKALRAFYDMKEAWLLAHPNVAERLASSRNEVEAAWKDVQLQWSEILDQQADLKIAILEEQAKGAGADRDLIEFLYDFKDAKYLELDAESFGSFYSNLEEEIRGRESTSETSLTSYLRDRIKHQISFPGRADFYYEQATPAEQKEIVETEKYHDELGKLMENLKDPRNFWSELEKAGLLERYLKENPDKRVDFQYAKDIRNVFRKGGYKKFWDNLVKDQDLLKEYLRRGGKEARAKYNKYLLGKRYYNAISALFKNSNGASDFFARLERDPWLRDQYYARNPEKLAGNEYFNRISRLFNNSTDARSFFAGLDKDPWLKAQYFKRNPEKAADFAAGKEYFNHISKWVDALKRDDFKSADRIWASMPAWVKSKYYARNPDKRAKAVRTTQYSANMGKWVELLKAKDYVAADKFFRSMPEWMQERYFQNHPDKRAEIQLDQKMLRAGAEYFLAANGDKPGVLKRNPELSAWLKKYGGKEAEFRGLINSIYRAIPKEDGWMKRKFAAQYPEIFSKEAIGERRLKKVARTLAENPDLVEPYNEAFAINLKAFEEQRKLEKKPPAALERERKRRLKRRSRRRAARFNAHWTMHAGIRHG
jgi:hypothetical protein